MTDQLIDQRGFDKSPREVWEEWQKTKYSDETIKKHIDNAYHNVHHEYVRPDQSYVQGQVMIARAMIEYNRMVDERIERARHTWG